MSREIKFRGKRIDNGEWVYGNYIYLRHEFDRESHFIQEIDAKWYSKPEYNRGWSHDKFQVIPETVGQYTGLKDKNGKDLDWWEGDLFDVLDTIRKIVFEEGCYWFKAVFPNKVIHQRLVCINIINDLDILPKKIGNVHEHPHLLEQQSGTSRI